MRPTPVAVRRSSMWMLSILTVLTSVPALARGGHGGGGRGGGHSGHVSVRSYNRSNGASVSQHHRSANDGKFGNNWTTRGNYNPDTGTAGTRVAPADSYR